MKILVLNCGSSSLKCQVFETSPEQIAATTDRVLAKAAVEKIGTRSAIVSITVDGRRSRDTQPIPTVDEALRVVLSAVTADAPVEAVGHRIVHGGEKFKEPVELTDEVVDQIEDLYDLAPLHNPHNVRGFRAARSLLPNARQVAVFDTAFHQTLPPHAYLYGIPYSYYAQDRLRRYGFHGVSHRYIAWRYAKIHSAPKERFRIISCHLGNGSSMCAIDGGRSIDTSMGFTPQEGLIMGTRSGDIDPSLVLHMMEQGGEGPQAMDEILTRKSGLFGLSGLSADMRVLLDYSGKGDTRAQTAIDVFCYRVKKYIGSYLAALNGADAVVFTGGVGENAPAIRARICAAMDRVGLWMDEAANEAAAGKEARISRPDSPVGVWVIPTNEELLIARDTLRFLLGLPQPD
ncbi:MAG: acetate kinase [Acidobacteria bacterium]|nr:acetate kinase [Acidobacteriota bacterium]